jgi:tRNA A22 N-methylase
MTLSKRLLAVAEIDPRRRFIADVGSDHAQLPLFLLEERPDSAGRSDRE